MIPSLNKMIGLHPHTTSWTAQLEGPQEVGSLLEVLTNCEDLVDQILNADDSTRTQHLFHHLVVADGDTLMVHLGETSLVHQVTYRLQVGVTPSDERFHKAEHVQRGFVELHEDTVVDLTKAEQLESFLHFWAHLIHTTDSNDERKFRLSWNVEVSVAFGHASKTDFVAFLGTVFFGVCHGTFVDDTTFRFQGLLLLQGGDGTCCLHALNVL